MTRFVDWSSRIYRMLLYLYPADLRRDFGQDMLLVFSEDLAASRVNAGIFGVVRVWSSALRELTTIALPGLAGTPIVIVPVLSFALSAFAFGGELILARAHASGDGVLPLDEAIRTLIVPPSVTAALVAFAAVRSAARSRTVSLQLGQQLGQHLGRAARYR